MLIYFKFDEDTIKISDSHKISTFRVLVVLNNINNNKKITGPKNVAIWLDLLGWA